MNRFTDTRRTFIEELAHETANNLTRLVQLLDGVDIEDKSKSLTSLTRGSRIGTRKPRGRYEILRNSSIVPS